MWNESWMVQIDGMCYQNFSIILHVAESVQNNMGLANTETNMYMYVYIYINKSKTYHMWKNFTKKLKIL